MELVALVPAIVMVALLGWQMALAGYAWTMAAGAARAGARAAEVDAPVRAAALAVLPGRLALGAEVVALAPRPGEPERVRVRVGIPRALPLPLPLPGTVAAEVALATADDLAPR